MTIGFASYNQILNISGSVGLVPGGVIAIKSVSTVGLTNASATPEIINNNTSIDFNLSFKTQRSEDAYKSKVKNGKIENLTKYGEEEKTNEKQATVEIEE